MKFLYHLLFLLLAFSNTYAQNWECIKTDDEYYYGKLRIPDYPKIDTSMVIVETIKIDSVYTELEYTIYRNHKSIEETECYYADGPSFLGKKVFSDTAGCFHFINKFDDTLHIKSDAYKDENWVFYFRTSRDLKIIAYIDTIVFDASLMLPDSVKIIKFFALNLQGDSIEHGINNKTVYLGKNHGFISIFDFRLLPGTINKYNLVGRKNTNIGYTNFGAAEIWDMEIGDEFHFLKTLSGSNCPFTTYYIRKVFDKQQIGNILYLDFSETAHKFSGELCSGNELSSRIYTETIDFEDPIVKRWNSIPGESYVAGTYAGYFNIYSSPDSMLQEKRHSFPPLERPNLTTDCFHVDIDPYDFNGYYYTIKGAGGYYFRGNRSVDYDEKLDFSLKYYKKGDKVFGNPFDPNTLAIYENNTVNPIINVYPNPADKKLTISIFDSQNSNSKIEIYSLSGVQLVSKNITTQSSELDIETLTSGIYFYRVIYKEGSSEGKFLKN